MLALAVVLVVVGASVGYRYSQRQVPVVVDPACPALVTNTSNGTQDFGDTVTWAGQTWWRSERRATAGAAQLGVVTCLVADIPNEQGWQVASGPWPDGAATALPRGTTLHPPREDQAAPALVASTTEGDVLYCVEDAQTGTPGC